MARLDMRLEAIFSQALKIASTEERAAYIQRAANDDKKLRREVEAMLMAHHSAGDFMRSNVSEMEDSTT